MIELGRTDGRGDDQLLSTRPAPIPKLHKRFDRGGRHYTLVDTAGVRKRGKVSNRCG